MENLVDSSHMTPSAWASPLYPDDQFTGPTTFLAGGKSPYIEAGDHPVIRSHFPAAAIVTIAESGHNPHLEAREAFVRVVREGRVAPGGAVG